MKILILDEQSVASSEKATFHPNPAVKHPDNPVLLPGQPHEWDSLQVSWPGTVLYSPRDRKFRCWYSGMDVLQTPDRFWCPGYAESDDGVHWSKPALGQVSFLGRRTNRLAQRPDQGDPRAVFENPLPDAPPSRRFGAYWFEHNYDASRGARYLRFRLAWSPDGVRWDMQGLVCSTAVTDEPDQGRPAFQDIYRLLYDPAEPDPAYRVKAYTQIMRPRGWGGGPEHVRHIGLMHGADFTKLQDAPQPVVLAPEQGIDEELHFASVEKIGGTYLMLFESDRFSRNPIHGDLRLAVGADGRRFRRVHPQAPVVSTGPKGVWDENLLVNTGSSMQAVGDEVCIFYFGCPNTYNSWPAQYAVSLERRGSMFAPSYLGLARLPRDRFGFAAGPGRLTLPPVEIGPAGLWLNADGTGLRVEALDANRRVVAQGAPAEQRRGGVYRKVRWSQPPPRGACTIRVDLPNSARLYSVEWHPGPAETFAG